MVDAEAVLRLTGCFSSPLRMVSLDLIQPFPPFHVGVLPNQYEYLLNAVAPLTLNAEALPLKASLTMISG